ncbi:MobF family relaxase [Tautonia sociabilis]|uniref:Conjugative relaxase n=1 Tax=Tautonia sociabilis TaxID=2080755 RepID=A0A432MLN6_9BACT|nr:MobF family relaxase [Tautonia sociabilis]RUL88008.1 conjugative relaxase [Tautonia sociabilis]
MLSISPLSSGRAEYYLQLANANYYQEGGEPPGQWYGQGAREFGLAGEVQPEHLERLCEGFHPHDGVTPLVRNAGRKEGSAPRKPGDDLTFSMPKSASIAWACASDELRSKIEQADLRAVRQALDYIEQTCGFARVGKQGLVRQQVPLTFALFRHASSRAGDPQIHTHAVCPNVAVHADGRTTAIDSTGFYHHKMAAGAIYRAALAEGLRQLGFAIERDGPSFQLSHIPEALTEHFSKRRAEIEEQILKRAGALEAGSARMAELITLETRRAKEERPRSERLTEWQEIAWTYGVDRETIAAHLRAPPPLTPSEKERVRTSVFAEAIRDLSEHHAHWSEKDLTQKIAEAAQGRGLDARDVLETVANKLASPDLVPLGRLVTEQRDLAKRRYAERSEDRYTTPEMLRIEREMLERVNRMADRNSTVGERIVTGVLGLRPTLSEEQAEAVRHLTTRPGLVQCLSGKAGTGKSYTLDTCRLVWELSGKEVIGCAIAGVAADELRRSANIPSDTLAMTIARLNRRDLVLTPHHVVVIDEAGMAPTKAMADLIAHVERSGAKLVLVGDAMQLQPIGAGGPFRSIAERVGDARLVQIRRQREEWRREAVHAFSRGEAKAALVAYLEREQLHVTEDRSGAMLRLVEQWKADGGVEKPAETLLLASLNVEVRTINRMCQAVRLEAGQLGERALHVDGDRIHEGDRIQFTKRSRALGIENGFTGDVLRVDERERTLAVRLDKGGREVTIRTEDYAHIRLAYCSTVHKAQGRTVERAHVLLGGPLTDRHLAYVQASRSRGETHLVIDEPSAGPQLRDAVRTLSRARQKDLAHDLIELPERQQEQQAPSRRILMRP